MRRPLVIWLSQALMTPVLLAIVWYLVSDIYEYGLYIPAPWDITPTASDFLETVLNGLLIVASIMAYIGMAFRQSWSRLLMATALLITFGWGAIIIVTDTLFWADSQGISNEEQFFFILFITALLGPFAVLGTALIFSTKAKNFLENQKGIDQAPPSPDPLEAEYDVNPDPSRDLDQPT